jgi:hypothetical protein
MRPGIADTSATTNAPALHAGVATGTTKTVPTATYASAAEQAPPEERRCVEPAGRGVPAPRAHVGRAMCPRGGGHPLRRSCSACRRCDTRPGSRLHEVLLPSTLASRDEMVSASKRERGDPEPVEPERGAAKGRRAGSASGLGRCTARAGVAAGAVREVDQGIDGCGGLLPAAFGHGADAGFASGASRRPRDAGHQATIALNEAAATDLAGAHDRLPPRCWRRWTSIGESSG